MRAIDFSEPRCNPFAIAEAPADVDRNPSASPVQPGGAGESEASLIAALKSGDNGAVDSFVRAHTPWMTPVARRVLADHQLAEDCVQEAFLNAFRKIDDFEGRSTLKAWLHRIVVNQALMKLRSKRSRNETAIDECLPNVDTGACRTGGSWLYLATPEEHLERKQRHALIRSKIKELPDACREILELRDIEEVPTRQVAARLGLTEGHVRVRLCRARAALSKLLEPSLEAEI